MNRITEGVKKFWKDEEGLQTLELMLIIAVVVVIALMFRDEILKWVGSLIDFGNTEINKFKNNEGGGE